MLVVAGQGITEGGVGGAFGVARALTRLGPGKTLEGTVGFTTGLTHLLLETHI